MPLGAVAGEDPPELQKLLVDGEAAYTKADYEAARASYEQAWKLAQETPRNNSTRYDILKRLTAIRAAQGEFEDADSYLQLAINWREVTNGVSDPKIAGELLQSVTLCRGMKNYERAMAILGRVRDMHARSEGADSIPVADDFTRMAQIFMDQKKPENAAASLSSALEIRMKVVGRFDPSLLRDLDRLGEILNSLNGYQEAEAWLRQSLVIREGQFGRESVELLGTLDGLAYACFGQKEYDVADTLYRRLIALWTTSAGPQHPMLAIAYDKVAVFYSVQKKFDEAKEAADHSNAIRAHFFASGLMQEAIETKTDGNEAEQKALYQKALALLDPPSPVYDELHGQLESIVKSLEPPPPPKRISKGKTAKASPNRN